MYRTVLVDDEPRGLNTLKKLLLEYCPELRIVAECADADSGREKIELLEPHILFLDISLPGKSGFDMLAELEKISFEIIFVTAHNEYTLQAFRYSAVDYLVKPIDEDLLVNAVARAVKRISAKSAHENINTLLHNIGRSPSGQDSRLCIPSLKGFQVVELKDIIYCEASGSYTNIYFTDGSNICASKPILEYEELLADAGFVRIHKSYLVNIIHIREYLRGEGGSVVLNNNMELEVSRRKKELFLSKIKTFYKF
ncbi:MAG TPA: LytTR family DNA-binding domain-containing protein [Chitinophagaceae bacterium]|nr:LytTR family DNA-binding domain-containing protein [Chitinophagaceae bacterium]